MNDFSKAMSEKETEDLQKIIKQKEGYQPEAVQAALDELEKRKKISEEGGFVIDDKEDFEYINKLKSLSNDDLINIFRIEYTALRNYEYGLLNQELKNRNIEPKEWYFISANNNKEVKSNSLEDNQAAFVGKSVKDKKGPFTTSELKSHAQKGEIKFNSYIWKEGLKHWIEAKEIRGLLEDAEWPDTKLNVVDLNLFKTQITAGIIFAAILSYIDFIYIGFQRFIYTDKLSDILYLVIFNSIFTIGILKLKKWGFITLIIKSLITGVMALLIVINAPELDTPYLIGLFLIDIIIVAILLSNKKEFYALPEKIGV
jgi:hypothetical protein